MAVSWRTSAFQKKRPWNPYFYSVFWVRAFWAKVSKKGNFEKPARKMENLIDNWKANFWYFCCSLGFFSLGPKPSLFFCCFFCYLFCFLVFSIKKPCFSPRKGHVLFFSVSLSLFWPPLFFCFSFSVFSFLFFFLSSFLSFLFAFFWFLVFVSFFIFLSSLLFFHERNHMKILNCKFCLHRSFLFFWFPVFFCFKFLFLSLLFPDFKLCFLFNIMVFDFQTNNLKKHFWFKRGVATKRFFLSTCVLENVKSYRFFGPFFGNFGRCSKTL